MKEKPITDLREALLAGTLSLYSESVGDDRVRVLRIEWSGDDRHAPAAAAMDALEALAANPPSPTPPEDEHAARSLFKPVAIALRELEDAERRAFNAHDPNLAKQIGDTARGLSGYLHEVSAPTPPAGAAEVREAPEVSTGVRTGRPRTGEMRTWNGHYWRFIEADDKGDVWEDCGPVIAPPPPAPALSAPVADDGWRDDMENAPRDAPLLLWTQATDGERGAGWAVQKASWLPAAFGGGDWLISCTDNRPVFADNPTHWRPLPPPPGQGEKP